MLELFFCEEKNAVERFAFDVGDYRWGLRRPKMT